MKMFVSPRLLGGICKVASVAILANIALMFYWLYLDDPEIITDQSASIENTGPIRAGDTLLIRTHFCQSREAIPESGVRQIKNAYISDLADHTITTQRGCGGRPFQIPLPTQMTPGPHAYAFSLSYRVNPFKTKTVALPDIPFMVQP